MEVIKDMLGPISVGYTQVLWHRHFLWKSFLVSNTDKTLTN